MNYAEIKEYDIANGPGVRMTLFVSGCRHHCKNCFNEIAWDFNYGNVFDEAVEDALVEKLNSSVVRGLTLLGGEPLRPVMNFMREEDEEPDELAQISKEGYGGILCIETGGPTPGLGCAGRGIIATFQLLEDMELFERYKPDVVLYDVLGDVVCGGFAAPIREGYASKVLIVTSGEKMALYAANNISSAVRNFEDRSYARVFGVVLNHRNVENEKEKVQAFAEKIGVPIVGEVPRSDEIIHWEEQGKTVIEGDPDSEISKCFFDLAELLWKEEENE